MTATVKLDAVLAPKSGVSAKGSSWVAQEFIVETKEKYPKKIAMSLFGEEKVKLLENCLIGDELTVDFDIESKEYNGRWFTQCNAWRLTHSNGSGGTNSNREQKSAAEAKEMRQEPRREDDFPF